MRRARWGTVVLLGAALVVLSTLRGGSLLDAAAGEAKHPSSARTARSSADPPAGKELAPEPDHSSAFHSAAACENYVRARARKERRGPRVGSWNIRWFPNGTKDGRDPTRRTDLRETAIRQALEASAPCLRVESKEGHCPRPRHRLEMADTASCADDVAWFGNRFQRVSNRCSSMVIPIVR